MNSITLALLNTFTFLWLGMVLAISFLEAPLKFRAPGITIPLGLGIGRIVFRALNIAEIGLALAIITTVAIGTAPINIIIYIGISVLILLGQLTIIRPKLNRRSDRVLAGADAPRSRAHLVYVTFEVLKVVVLIMLGIGTLTA